jgi:cytidylate kinase
MAMPTGGNGRSESPLPPAVVTLAALYGAGGSVVGPRVAERMGVPFLDREIPEAVAKETGLPERAVETVDEQPQTVASRVMATLGRAATVGGTGSTVERLDVQERGLRGHIEKILAQAAASGGVALGRGGMVVLCEVPWALHVHLGGAREARIRQAMRIDGVERDEAERRQKIEDRTRIEYVRRSYGVDGADPAHYHLMLDSTALELDVCVELIVAASEALRRNPRPLPTT